MKNTITKLTLSVVIALTTFISCSGPQGDPGPKGDIGATGSTGPRGETGSSGANGTNGKDGATGATGATGSRGETGATGAQGPKGDAGNANVIQLDFPSRNVVNESQYLLPANISSTLVENGAFFIYVTVGGHIYPLPGTVQSLNSYRTVYLSTKSFYVIRTSSSTNTDIFSKTRIIIISASDIRSGRKAGIDYNNYNAVKKYYNLND
jgi:Collagen triple helix repeat (20 copies)